MISKRTKVVAKYMSFYSKYSIVLYIHKRLGIRFLGTEKLVSCWYVMTSDKKMDGKTEEGKRDDYIYREIHKYSVDPIEEWKQLLKHVLEIFKKQTIDVLSMAMDAFVDQNISIIDFLKSNVKTVEECSLYQGNNINVNKHTAYLLDNLIVTNELNSYLLIKNVNFKGKIPKNLEELYIYNSQWIGFKRLLEIDCKNVILRKNRISDKQWNLFIKKWISMETNQNLEYLELDYRELDKFRNRVLHDIPYEVVSEEVSRIMTCSYNETQEINGGIDIRRIDGKTATFFVLLSEWGDNFLMCVH
ncbi:hypothetical protein CRE_19600 [Caenorhabditis remanei]|uniref:Sdz-33 F-box domain-containing protein n=1 Tax=Caenorhabditis remanei TaxID=31234 RepID=E3NSK8_CAERE|nr:hypothetical protein CRE_19600 [Caenorhabditis remanei]